MLTLLAILLGLALGSFATVAIHRLPLNQSLLVPRSHCPHCRTPLKWYDNLPLLSFLVLCGRCRVCHHRISWQYPVVETLSALLAVGAARGYPSQPWLLLGGIFVVTNLLVASFIDLRVRLIPDAISFTLIGFGVASAGVNPLLGQTWTERLGASLLGMAAGGGGLYAVAMLGGIVFRTDALGGGDIKLLAGLGSLLGWSGVVGTVLIASSLGAAIGLMLLMLGKIHRKTAIPFGPFLSLGAYLSWLFPDWWRLWAATIGL
ncbi:MAG: prepilin peptidase [Elusimicrobia bacterium]|nr:prepilin peptidase [Elusimicrobiota bacterium]